LLSRLSRLHRSSTVPSALKKLRSLGLATKVNGRWLGRPPGENADEWFSQRASSSWRKKFHYQAIALPSVDSPLKLVDAVVCSQLLLTPELPNTFLASRFGLDRRTVAAAKVRVAQLKQENGGKIDRNWFMADKTKKTKKTKDAQPSPPLALLTPKIMPDKVKPQDFTPQPESLANVGQDYAISIAGQKDQNGSLVDQIMKTVGSSKADVRKAIQRAINKMLTAGWNDREVKQALLCVYELRCKRAADPEDKFSDEMFEICRDDGNLAKALRSAEKGNGYGLFTHWLKESPRIVIDNDQEITDDDVD
jgi:hypothetical protein